MLSALRRQLDQVIAPSAPSAPGFATGIAPLDALLPEGIPQGRLSEIIGPLASGKTTVLHGVVASVLSCGFAVAYVDALGTLAPRSWAPFAERGFWLVQPPNAERGAWCADLLLRSGAFALVVLDGAPRLTRSVALRLVGLARDRNAAFVVLGEESGGSALGGAVRMLVRPAAGAAIVTVTHGGLRQSVELNHVIPVAYRLCTHPEVPDRRGVERRRRQ